MTAGETVSAGAQPAAAHAGSVVPMSQYASGHAGWVRAACTVVLTRKVGCCDAGYQIHDQMIVYQIV